MKIKEIIKEGHYAASIADFDDIFNPECAKYYRQEQDRAEKIKKAAVGGIPLITKERQPNTPPWSIDPDKNVQQSAGYRGLQSTRKKAGLPSKRYTVTDKNAMIVPRDTLINN